MFCFCQTTSAVIIIVQATEDPWFEHHPAAAATKLYPCLHAHDLKIWCWRHSSIEIDDRLQSQLLQLYRWLEVINSLAGLVGQFHWATYASAKLVPERTGRHDVNIRAHTFELWTQKLGGYCIPAASTQGNCLWLWNSCEEQTYFWNVAGFLVKRLLRHAIVWVNQAITTRTYLPNSIYLISV